MATVNPNYSKLQAGYLFPEIGKRMRAFQAAHPDAKIKRLGIGDTTEPLVPAVTNAMHEAVDKLAHRDTYTGYGAEQGEESLRKALAGWYKTRGVDVGLDEVFVSDGAKCDVANIRGIFGVENIAAVQDPAYPVYVDTNVISGNTAGFDDATKTYKGIVYMSCTPENGFFPGLPKEHVDLIYICSPNNPTGAVWNKDQLKQFVDFARDKKAAIIFDSAYQAYIKDPSLPRSIYEVEGAKECAIEINSFSKWAGFTGMRLGWSVVPKVMRVEGTSDDQINKIWNRRQTTCFNGASNVVQAGALAALSDEGLAQNQGLVDYYMENARIVREGLTSMDIKCYGGVNAPFLWMETPQRVPSWDFFKKLLNEANVVCTPGSGFGPSGEGFVRLSAFGHREGIEAAVESIKTNLKVR